MPVPPLKSARLMLIPMLPAFLEACQSGDHVAAEALIGLRVPDEWYEEQWLIQLRLNDMRADPDYEPWSLRAIALTQSGEMIGHIGFHSPPGPAYLQAYAPGGIELGYTVFPAYRRQGYAREAVAAMLEYAREQGVPRFVLSISPENAPSLAIAHHFGFAKVGSYADPEDSEEIIFAREAITSSEKKGIYL